MHSPTTTTLIRRVVPGLVAVGLLASCGGDDDSADDAAPTQNADDSTAEPASPSEGTTGDASLDDPCSILTADDVAALIGAPVTAEAQPAVTDTAGGCNYDPTPDDAGLWRISYQVGEFVYATPDDYLAQPGLDGWTVEELEVGERSAIRITSPDGELRGVTVLGTDANVSVDVQGPLSDEPLLPVTEAAVAAFVG